MGLTLTGDFGKTIFSGLTSDNGKSGTRYMSIESGEAINFFQKIAMVYPDVALNELGLFSQASIGRNDKVSFASFRTPKHLWSKRKNGCVWSPKGTIRLDVSEFTIAPIEYMGEECPDAFWGDCLEKIFGVGNDVRDFYASAEARTALAELMRLIFLGLGNSMFELAYWGEHPIIADATAGDWYTGTPEEWTDFVDQQGSMGGIMTMVDSLKNDEGLPNYNVEILNTEYDGATYTGDPRDLFERCRAAALPEMALSLRTGRNSPNKPIILVSRSIFTAYKDILQSTWLNIPDTFYFQLQGKYPGNMMPPGAVDGILAWEGFWVVAMDAFDVFDTLTGTVTHRCLMVTPGVFGLATDVPTLDRDSAYGLKLTQKLDAPDMGKIYMDTTLKVGTGILDRDFIVNASVTLAPGQGI